MTSPAFTPADLRHWSLSNLLTEYGARCIAHDRAVRAAGTDGPDVDLSQWEQEITLVADEIERRAS